MTLPQNDAATAAEYKDRLHRYFGNGIKLALLIGAIWLGLEEQYQAAVETLVILGLTYLSTHLGTRLHVRIPPEFASLALLFVCMALFLGEVLDFYNRYWWWDIALHAESAFLLGIVGYMLVYILNENDSINFDLSPGFISLFAFMFSIGLGVIWEIFEFAMDSIFGMNMQKTGLDDTMWDLIVDCIGALCISVMGYFFLRTTESDSFLEHWMDRFVADNPRLFRRGSRH